jgi:hypothetical protein
VPPRPSHAADCKSKYALTGINTWRVEEKGQSDLIQVRSGISISLRKLFEGPSPIPEISVVKSIDDLQSSATFSFRGTKTVGSDWWRAANVEFSETFDAEDLGAHDTWVRVEIHCRV